MRVLDCILEASVILLGVLYPSASVIACAAVYFVQQAIGSEISVPNYILFVVAVLQWKSTAITMGAVKIVLIVVEIVGIAGAAFLIHATRCGNLRDTRGKYHIGYRKVFVQTRGIERNLDDNEPQRKIPVYIMFPTQLKGVKNVQVERIRIFEHASATAKGISKYTGIHPVLFSHFSMIYGIFDQKSGIASPEKESGWPIVLLSHGLSADPKLYASTMREIASQGFVVIAPTHSDGSANVIHFVENGEFKFILSPPSTADEIRKQWRQRQLEHRQKEVSAVISALVDICDEKITKGPVKSEFESLIENKLDFNRIGLWGHSFGGATSLLSAFKDVRFKAVVNLDGWMLPIPSSLFDEGIHERTSILTIMSEEFANYPDQMLPEKKLIRKCRSKQNIFYVFKGTTHQAQCDLPTFYRHVSSKNPQLKTNFPSRE
jgi:dienelactone hydrolase